MTPSVAELLANPYVPRILAEFWAQPLYFCHHQHYFAFTIGENTNRQTAE